MREPAAIKEEIAGNLKLQVYENRQLLGRAAAADVIDRMKQLLAEKEQVRMIFAAAPSQNEYLEHLAQANGIDWSRVTVFHMDEYIGLPNNSPQKFSHFLCKRLFDIVKPGRVHLIDSSNPIENECQRYGELIKEAPIDIVCLGIGENGHIAFNDPPVADFNDPEVIKPVELDEICRLQQVNDGCFETLENVPAHALTLTIPTMMSGSYLFCMVPGVTKRDAVRRTLYGELSTECPASILREHPNCILYADTDSYGSVDADA